LKQAFTRTYLKIKETLFKSSSLKDPVIPAKAGQIRRERI
jgi:hypothetical protein